MCRDLNFLCALQFLIMMERVCKITNNGKWPRELNDYGFNTREQGLLEVFVPQLRRSGCN
jgi:hypothetical protein